MNAMLNIEYNDVLSDCSIQSICDYLASPNGTIYITDNDVGCNSLAEIEANCPTVSLEDTGYSNNIDIYSDPTEHLIAIINYNPTSSMEVVIYDLCGKQLLDIVQENLEIDVSSLIPGIYLVEVITEKSTVRNKVLIW